MLKLRHCLTRCTTALQTWRPRGLYQRIQDDTLNKIQGKLKPEPLLDALAGTLEDIKANNVFRDSA